VTPTQAERSETTRAALLTAGRALFADRGYAEVPAAEVVARAQVTRGALYHHFRDKRDLFRAVFEQIEEEMVAAIARRVAGASDPWSALVTGTDAFLEACLDPVIARIALEEAPSVLGWSAWREIDARYALGLVTAALTAGMDAGVLARRPVEPLAHVLLGALGEAGLLVASASDPAAARDEVRGSLLALLEGLRS
jgi:AcrR family transcriptional regulator